MSDIITIAEQFQFKLTALRRDILQLFVTAEKPLKAYEILTSLKAIRPNAKPPTVYRVLDFFVQHGVLHRLDSCNAFTLCQLSDSHGKVGDDDIDIILICRRCSEVIEFSDMVLSALLKKIEVEHGVRIDVPQIELQGQCQQCLTA